MEKEEAKEQSHVYFPDKDLQEIDDVPGYVAKLCYETHDDPEFIKKALKIIFEVMEKKGWIKWTKK